MPPKKSAPATASPKDYSMPGALLMDLNGATDQEIIEVYYWLKIMFVPILGIIWGQIRFTGLNAFSLALFLTMTVVRVHYTVVSSLTEERLNSIRLQVLSEGGQICFGLFMFTWIASYSLAV
eukprot:Clim_evm69s88 gene=Clim_evmTU69s88